MAAVRQRAVDRTEKACPRCGIVKELALFVPKRGAIDGTASYCKVCQKELNDLHYDSKKAHAHYLLVRSEIGSKGKARRDERKSLFIVRLGGSCKRCGISPGEEWPVDCFDFHHNGSAAKERAISGSFTTHGSDDAIWKEAQKCDVLCATCHRREHSSRKK